MAVESPRPSPAETAAAARRRAAAPVRNWAAGRLVGLALLYLFIPVFIVVLFSFNDNQGRFNFTWQGFTLAPLGAPVRRPGPGERR